MKPEKFVSTIMLVGASVLPTVFASPPAGAADKPIYVNFFQHLDDHVNKESFLAGKRVAELYAKYGVKADFYPITLSLQRALELAPEYIETLKRLDMPICYHGLTHHKFDPMRDRIGDKDWDAAVEEAIYCETHAFDPLKSVIDPDKPGGIGLIKQTFGKPPIYALRRSGVAAERAAWKKLGVKMSGMGWPLCWELGLLCTDTDAGRQSSFMPNLLASQTPTSAFGPHTAWEAAKPVEKPDVVFAKFVENLRRDRLNFVTIAWHPFQFRFVPEAGKDWGAMYAKAKKPEDIPDHFIPATPISAEETDKIFAVYEDFLRYVVSRKDLTIATSADLANMVEPLPEQRDLPRATLKTAAENMVREWVNYPPNYIKAGDDSLSLADAFQAYANALAAYAAKGSLPEKVTVREIWGPTDTPISLGVPYSRTSMMDIPRDVIPGADVVKTAAAVAPKIKDRVPGYIFPEGIKLVDRQAAEKAVANLMDTGNIALRETCFAKGVLNPAEFLYCMAQAYLNIERKSDVGTVLLVHGHVTPSRARTEISGWGELKGVPGKQEWYGALQSWTYKPAKVKAEFADLKTM